MKKGFTLAEVLIALGIIGVVAAVTLPGLNVNVQKSQVGPALMKAINVLQNANKLLLHDNNARTLTAACNGTAYIQCVANFVGGVPINIPNNSYKFFDYSDANINNSVRGSGSSSVNAIVTKDGINYIWLTTTRRGPRRAGQPQRIITTEMMYVDINGVNKSPNIIGRDTFRIEVESDGTVLPFGGREYADINGGAVLWETQCNNNATPTNGMACAGSIVDNGGKVIYPW